MKTGMGEVVLEAFKKKKKGAQQALGRALSFANSDLAVLPFIIAACNASP